MKQSNFFLWLGTVAAFSSVVYALVSFYRAYEKTLFRNSVSSVAHSLAQRMDSASLLGQLFMMHYTNPKAGSILEVQPGALFLQKSSIPVRGSAQNISLLKKHLKYIKNQFEVRSLSPPFIAVDQEYGSVQRLREGFTEFPSAMAMGYAASRQNDYKKIFWIAFHSCRELKSVGVDWPLAPVADIQTNWNNLVIGTRSFGLNADVVSKAVRAYSKGLTRAGCMNTLKHFPGHGSFDSDSHKILPVSGKSLKELENEELIPFEAAQEEAESIMPGHLLFKLIDNKTVTFSSFWLQKYLRDKLNFDGIILTDDLGMKAASSKLNEEHIFKAAFSALEAGVDMLLFADGVSRFAQKVHSRLLRKMEIGELSKKRVLDSAVKIIIKKLEFGLYQDYLKKESLKTTQGSDEDNIKKMRFLLRRLNRKKRKIDKLTRQAPSKEQLNHYVSANAVSHFWGSRASIDPKESVLFTDTDLTASSLTLNHQGKAILNKFSAVHNWKSINHQVLLQKPKKTVILNLYERKWSPELKRLLTLKNRKNVAIFSVINPFPFDSIKRLLKKGDSLVLSFSNSNSSQKALLEALLKTMDL